MTRMIPINPVAGAAGIKLIVYNDVPVNGEISIRGLNRRGCLRFSHLSSSLRPRVVPQQARTKQHVKTKAGRARVATLVVEWQPLICYRVVAAVCNGGRRFLLC